MTTETQVRVPVSASTEFVKGINLTSATTLVIGSMIGSGIFIVSADIARLVASPALLILGGPLSFRATCYYYRKAYYRAFFLDPAACAVNEGGRHRYKGETAFPFILQNLHRYTFFLALIFLGFLWYDAIYAFNWNGHFGIGLGTLIMLVNVCLLTLYSFSCHSLRHLAGGKLDCFSCVSFSGTRHSTWKGLSWLNERHMLWAWLSLFSVGLTDFYIRLISSGAVRDIRIL